MSKKIYRPFCFRGKTYTATLERDGNWWVAYCDKLNTVSQGRTIKSAMRNLKDATKGYYEVLENQKQPEKPKKNLYQKIDGRTPDLRETFHEAKEGFRTLVHDIGTYVKKHPEGTVVRMLSPLQIILVIMFLISSITITFWLLTHLLPW